MITRRRLLPVLLFALLLADTAFAQFAAFKTGVVTIETATAKHVINVELALDPAQKSQGLMFRTRLAPDAGMLFLYDHAQPVSFWMKNTLIPLDMLFIAPSGRIVGIHERAVPQTLDPIESGGPVLAVLELNGGSAARLDIKPGDHVRGPQFSGGD